MVSKSIKNKIRSNKSKKLHLRKSRNKIQRRRLTQKGGFNEHALRAELHKIKIYPEDIDKIIKFLHDNRIKENDMNELKGIIVNSIITQLIEGLSDSGIIINLILESSHASSENTHLADAASRLSLRPPPPSRSSHHHAAAAPSVNSGSLMAQLAHTSHKLAQRRVGFAEAFEGLHVPLNIKGDPNSELDAALKRRQSMMEAQSKKTPPPVAPKPGSKHNNK